jgi:hypothetical protein
VHDRVGPVRRSSLKHFLAAPPVRMVFNAAMAVALVATAVVMVK